MVKLCNTKICEQYFLLNPYSASLFIIYTTDLLFNYTAKLCKTLR